MNKHQLKSFLLWLHKTDQHSYIMGISDKTQQLAYIDSLKPKFFKQYPLGLMITSTPIDHPINKPEKSGIQANFSQDEVADYEDDDCF